MSSAVHALLLAVVTVYLYPQLDRGWIPHDEGTLAHAAERVLTGELPHIDFDDPYTGGQAVLHAAAFKVFGTSSRSIRLVLFGFTLLFTSVMYLLASRVSVPWVAGVMTLLAVGWSVPNYFAGVPSWYNLFFAVFGTWTLVKYDETDRPIWLVATGALAGLSFLFKVAGLFFLAACLLFVVYREQDSSPELEWRGRIGAAGTPAFALVSTLALATFSLALILLVRHRPTVMDGLHFLVPGLVLSGYLVVNEWRVRRGTSAGRFRHLFTALAWLGVGAVAPVAVFLVPYVLNSGLILFVHGVFVLPQKRLQWAGYPLPPVMTLLAAVPWVVLLVTPLVTARRWRNDLLAVVAAGVSGIGALYVAKGSVYQTVWSTTRPLVPITVLLCGMLVARGEWNEQRPDRRRLMFLFTAVASMVSLVQFPYSFAIYYCYAAPPLILALASIVCSRDQFPRGRLLCVLLFYLGFSLVWLNDGDVRHIGVRYVPRDYGSVLDSARFGLRISDFHARLYQDVIAEVQRHSKSGEYIYATSDCPEIYFLADRKNPTRTFYDFFDADYALGSGGRTERIVEALERHSVNVVVFHWPGEFSGPPPRELVATLSQRYPNVRHFLRGPREPIFSVAWR